MTPREILLKTFKGKTPAACALGDNLPGMPRIPKIDAEALFGKGPPVWRLVFENGIVCDVQHVEPKDQAP